MPKKVRKKNNVDKVSSPPARPPVRPPERGVRGAQPSGMQGFGGAARNVQGVRGAQRPGCGEVQGVQPPGYIYIYIYI